MVERLVLLGRGPVIEAADIPAGSLKKSEPARSEFSGEIMPIRELQRRYAVWALSQVGGHRGRAAERLGIDAKTLWKWLLPPRGRGGGSRDGDLKGER
jgi:two-component system, NtrC family, response regulator HydG